DTLCFIRIQFIGSHLFQYIDVAGNHGQGRAQIMNDHMGKVIPRLQCRPKSGSLDTFKGEIRSQAKENGRVEGQEWRQAGKIKILVVVKPKGEKWCSGVDAADSKQAEPRRPDASRR